MLILRIRFARRVFYVDEVLRRRPLLPLAVRLSAACAAREIAAYLAAGTWQISPEASRWLDLRGGAGSLPVVHFVTLPSLLTNGRLLLDFR